MATGTLTSTTIAARYKSILKLTGTANDVLAADASAKYIEDGDGNDSVLSLSTTRVGIGNTAPTALLTAGAITTLLTDGTTAVTPEGVNIHITEASKYAMGIKNADASGDGLIIQAGDASDDYALRVEDYDSANDLLVVRGDGNVGIGTATPDHLLDVEGSAGTSMRVHATGSNGYAALELDSHGTGDAVIQFAGGSTKEWTIGNDSTNDYFKFGSNADGTLTTDTRVTITPAGKVGIGETDPDAMLTITAILDQVFFSCKAENVAHGLTGVAGADGTNTNFLITEGTDDVGGVHLHAIMDATGTTKSAFKLSSYNATAAATGEAADEHGEFMLMATKHDGSNTQSAHAADGNLLSIGSNGFTQFIVKGDGEIFSNETATVGTYDKYDDAQLVRAYDLSHGKGVIDGKFDQFVQYNKEKLKELRLIGKDSDGNATGFINITGMQRLHNGAIWQQYTEIQKMKELVYDAMVELMGKEKANEKLATHDINMLDTKLLD